MKNQEHDITSEMKPLEILKIENDSFRLNKENFNRVLNKVGNRPFVLYSINEPTGTGKSYALSYFLQYFGTKCGDENWAKVISTTGQVEERFIWQNGVDRTTVGINLWPEPFLTKDNDGREVAVLLMDTQGLFDEKSTSRENAIIFSLSALCFQRHEKH
ncbi:Atlastin-1 [Pseudolycoriella hygida]|uniref:Atlastin-1 n=1 Tax=Pseudolycoriella hygida TaxID=35572 RepID=A0A9Q0N2W8_9DIPT|nr:Atlastin-1 [Pseudolycoriella hygida]